MKNVTVFCGSGNGNNPIYLANAFLVGSILAEQGIGVVYGGAKIGLMGAVADGALSNGGKVYGIIPDFLRNKEIAHHQITELIVVQSMHERKMKMNELCDGVLALPGGLGTLEELFEMLTWAQLGLHEKPIAILNINGYYDALLFLLNRMVKDGLLRKEHKEMIIVHDDPNHILRLMNSYIPPKTGKWISKDDV